MQALQKCTILKEMINQLMVISKKKIKSSFISQKRRIFTNLTEFKMFSSLYSLYEFK